MIIQMLISGVLLPAVVGFTAILLLWRQKQPERSRRAVWITALALTLSFLSGWLLLRGVPQWPVPDSVSWLPWLAIGGLLLGWISSIQKLPQSTLSLIQLLAATASVWLCTLNIQKYTWQDQSWLWIGGLSVLLFLVWMLWENVAARQDGALAPLLLTINFATLAIVALIGETAVISQTAVILCAGFGAMLVAAWIRPNLDLSQATLFVAMPLFGGLLINAFFYANLKLLPAILLLACGVAAVLASRLTRKLRPLPQLALAALFTLLPLILIVGLHFMQQEPASSSSSDDYYDDYYGI